MVLGLWARRNWAIGKGALSRVSLPRGFIRASPRAVSYLQLLCGFCSAATDFLRNLRVW